MSILLDSRKHAEALKAAIKLEIGKWQIYDYGKVPGADGNPGKLPDIYALLTVERRYNPLVRSTKAGSAGWRATVRVVGRTVDEARWASLAVTAALNESRLEILTDAGPRYTSSIQFESEQSPEPDDGRYSALSSWTYTHS